MLLLKRYSVLLTYLGTALVLGFIAVLVLGNRESDPYQLPAQIEYNFHVRPILSNNCYACHGPDSSSREAGLRLDTKEGATAILKSGLQAIVVGKSHASELIDRVSHEDESEIMPPPDQGKPLSERDIAILEKWIDQGAEYKPHWSLIPPQKPRVPQASNRAVTYNEIDHFIHSKLQKRSLPTSPITDKTKLIRRLSFVLTGLPPHPDHVRQFKSDTTEQAYEKWVDYYLQSPHFGERWARHWMDLVRYAETRGHEFDYEVGGAWHYRDYLIRAFNQDVSYDQLVREHLTGDLIQQPRRHPQLGSNESVIGTAYLALGEGKHSPVDIKEEEAYRIENMIDVTSKAFQGLTVGCAKCHDHKFDPIPTRDYYAMYGMFESMRMTQIPVGHDSETTVRLEKIESLKTLLRKDIGNSWLGKLDKNPPQKVVLHQPVPSPKDIPDTLSYEILADFRKAQTVDWFTDGQAFEKEVGIGLLNFTQDSQYIQSLEMPLVSTRAVGRGVIGALRSPNFVIAHDTLNVLAKGQGATIRVVIDNFQLIQYPIYGGLSREIDTLDSHIFGFRTEKWKGHKAYIEILPGQFDRHVYQTNPEAFIDVYYAVAFNGEYAPDMTLENDRHRLSANSVSLVHAINRWIDDRATVSDIESINSAMSKRILSRKLFPQSQKLLFQIDSLESTIYQSSYIEGVTSGEKIESPIFYRGNHNQPLEDPIPHGFLSAITLDSTHFESAYPSRLAWVDAMFHPDNPLTARVMVNRLWHHAFGRGIVETVDNLGVQGKLPTHPELLDYLAITFRENSWSMKHMLKMMVMSTTFQRDTQPQAGIQEKDPQNRYLSHYPIRRLEAEAIRDAILATSGCLDSTLYGESIAVHLTAFMSGRGRPSHSGPLDGAGRRSIYTAVRRNFLSPFMITFDMPVPATTFGNRSVTNIPAQSLTLMNDPFVIQQAANWAKRLLSQHPAVWENRLIQLYWEAFSRAPTQSELDSAEDFLVSQGKLYDQCEDEWLHDPRTWQDLCHAMINTKAFIYLL